MVNAPQFILEFPMPEDLSPHSFVPLPCNQQALSVAASLNSSDAALIYGAPKSGKTHLLQFWAQQSEAIVVSSDDICTYDINPNGENLAIDNLDIADKNSQEKLFHLFNLNKETRHKLLFASEAPAAELKVIPELQSRLLTAPNIQIQPPTASDLQLLLVKWAADRQLELSPEVVNYIITHAERSTARLLNLLISLDKLSIAEKRKITVPLIKRIM